MADIVNYLIELKKLKENKEIIDETQVQEIDNLISLIENLIPDEEKNMISKIESTKSFKSESNFNTNTNDEHTDFKIKIKYVNESKNPEPIWAKEGDSGFDLRANLPNDEKEVILQPLERMLIPTGLYFELPKGHELQIRPRSGHSFKTGLMAILGTVDTGYRGEIKVIMVNLSNEPQKIEQGERIAQGVVAPRISTEFGKLIKLESTRNLTPTERGSGGFGSTGTK